MTITAQDMTQALIDMSASMPDGADFLRDVRDGLTKRVGAAEAAVHVTIATPTGDAGALCKDVEEMLMKKLNRPVEITERADASLLGGAVITFGDEQIDMSVRGALTQAADAIVHAAVPTRPS